MFAAIGLALRDSRPLRATLGKREHLTALGAVPRVEILAVWVAIDNEQMPAANAALASLCLVIQHDITSFLCFANTNSRDADKIIDDILTNCQS